jgi:hypothetical protein
VARDTARDGHGSLTPKSPLHMRYLPGSGNSAPIEDSEVLAVVDASRGQGSKLLRNPMMPALITWSLLCVAHVLVPMPSDSATQSLLASGIIFVIAYVVMRGVRIPLPWIPERDVKLLVAAAYLVLLLEAFYFGLPITGGVDYNKFGFPILHHIVFSIWVAPLLAPRHHLFYLGAALLVGVLLLHRQVMVLAVACYFMRCGVRNVAMPILVVVALALLGTLRNYLLGVNIAAGMASDAPVGMLAEFAFWGYLYTVGPYNASLGSQGDLGTFLDVGAYWNTVPEWAVLGSVGVPVEASLALFYLLMAGLAIFLTRLRLFEARMFGVLLHCLSLITFFSSTIIQTPIIGTFLIVVAIRRGQQMLSSPT